MDNESLRSLYSGLGNKYQTPGKKQTKKNHLKSKVLKDAKDGKCFLCGYAENYASLDFHHVGKKSYSISQWIQRKSLEELEMETDKCVLLCKNCHCDIHNPTQSKNARSTMNKISKLPANENITITYVV